MEATMESAVVLRDEIKSELDGKINPVKLATVYLPRMEQALEAALTPQETNEVRTQIETVKTYLKRMLPRTNKERWEQFKFTHPAEWLYLEACKKAGALWGPFEEKQPVGRPNNSGNFQNYLSVIDAGFKDAHDAMDCQRLSWIEDEDWRLYKEETLTNFRQPTINGAVNVWRMLNLPPAQHITQLSYPAHINAVYEWVTEGAEILQTMVQEVGKGTTSRRAISFAIEQLSKMQQQMEASKKAIGEMA